MPVEQVLRKASSISSDEVHFDERVAESLTTIRDYIRYAVSCFNQAGLFYGHGTDNAWDEAVQLILNTVHLPWDMSEVVMDSKLTESEKTHILNRLKRRVIDRVPAPYLTGEAWFMGLPFYVDERVLVPRSPIAEMIENEFQPWLQAESLTNILDLCCGSGCIGIAASMMFPEADVDIVDLSKDALDVAAINIDKHGVGGRVTAIESDLFENVQKKYQVIVSNPPYVDAHDIAEMPPEFQNEPLLGLAAGVDGLDLVRRILKEARNYLTDDGILIVETGNSWTAMEEVYPEVPFTWIEFEFGGHGVFILSAAELDQYQSYFNR